MNLFKFAAAFVLLISATASCLAGDLAYTYEVLHVYRLSEKGTLETSNWENQMKGSAFSVSRLTGEIIGLVVPTLTAKSTRVVNKGSE